MAINSAEPDLSVVAGRVSVISVCAAGLESPHGACYALAMLRIGTTLGPSVGPGLGRGIVRAGMESVCSSRVSSRNSESHYGCRAAATVPALPSRPILLLVVVLMGVPSSLGFPTFSVGAPIIYID